MWIQLALYLTSVGVSGVWLESDDHVVITQQQSAHFYTRQADRLGLYCTAPFMFHHTWENSLLSRSGSNWVWGLMWPVPNTSITAPSSNPEPKEGRVFILRTKEVSIRVIHTDHRNIIFASFISNLDRQTSDCRHSTVHRDNMLTPFFCLFFFWENHFYKWCTMYTLFL